MRNIAISVLLICLLCGGVLAGTCRTRPPAARRARAVVGDAVPLLVVVQPTLFYSYRAELAAQAPIIASQDGAQLSAAPNERTIENVLTRNCAECHAGDAPRGGVAFFDSEQKLIAKLPRRAILEMTTPDGAGQVQMPPGERAKLSADEIELLWAWAAPPRDLWY